MSTDSVSKRSSDTKAEKLPKKKAKTTDPLPAAAATNEAPKQPAPTNVRTTRSAASRQEQRSAVTASAVAETHTLNGHASEHVIPQPPRGKLAELDPPTVAEAKSSPSSKTTNGMLVTPQSTIRPSAPAATTTSDKSSNTEGDLAQAPSSKTSSSRGVSILHVLLSIALVLSNVASLGLWAQSRLDTEVQLNELATLAGADTEELSSGLDSVVSLGRILERLQNSSKSQASALANLKTEFQNMSNQRQALLVEKEGFEQRLQEERQKRDREIFHWSGRHADMEEKNGELEKRISAEAQHHVTAMVQVAEERNDLRNKNVALEERVNHQAHEHESIVQEWRERTEDLERMVRASQAAAQERNEWRQRAAVLAEQEEKLTTRAQELEHEVQLLYQEQAQSQGTIGELTDELGRLRNHVRELEERLGQCGN